MVGCPWTTSSVYSTSHTLCVSSCTTQCTSIHGSHWNTTQIQQGEVKPEKPPLQDQILDPEQSEVLQAQHSVSNLPGVSSSESEEKGDTNVNTASKATNDEINQAISNSPAAGGDLQSMNLNSATEATTHDY